MNLKKSSESNDRETSNLPDLSYGWCSSLKLAVIRWLEHFEKGVREFIDDWAKMVATDILNDLVSSEIIEKDGLFDKRLW